MAQPGFGEDVRKWEPPRFVPTIDILPKKIKEVQEDSKDFQWEHLQHQRFDVNKIQRVKNSLSCCSVYSDDLLHPQRILEGLTCF